MGDLDDPSLSSPRIVWFDLWWVSVFFSFFFFSPRFFASAVRFGSLLRSFRNSRDRQRGRARETAFGVPLKALGPNLVGFGCYFSGKERTVGYMLGVKNPILDTLW